MAWDSATALDALRGGDLLEIGMSANQTRCSLHPENVVTYELSGTATSLTEASNETVSAGGGNVDLSRVRDTEYTPLDILEASLLACHKQFPEVTFHNLPISRLQAVAGDALALAETFRRLREIGLRSLTTNFYPAQISGSPADLSTLLRLATKCDIFTSVSITIGNSESLEQRVKTIAMVRALQEESNAILAVLIRVHHAATAEARREEEATAVDYLKTLAVTRLFLDNVEHLQTDWSVMGPKVLELALRFGADDAGLVPRSQAGNPEPSHHGGESELRRIIRDAGFRPVERDALFRQSLLR
jgi:cyclic dehypoxanthinyl futalosine synthase